MEATAAPHHSEPSESAAPNLPVPAAAAPRATITSFSPGSARLPVPVLVLPIPRLLLRVSTPPQYHTPSLPHPLAAGLPCMVAITGDTLDTTPSYNSTPGDNIFKSQIVITGVFFLSRYTVANYRRLYTPPQKQIESPYRALGSQLLENLRQHRRVVPHQTS